MNQNLFYYAQIEEIASVWKVRFPDFPHLEISGQSFWDALARAEAALNAALEAGLASEKPLPVPTDFHGAMGYFPIQVKSRVCQSYARKRDART